MTRQRLTWLVLVVLFAGLLAWRGFTGHGLGRVYVERGEVSLARERAPADAPAASVPRWRSVPVEQAEVRWTTWSKVPPKAHFEAEARDPGQDRVVLSWPRTIGLWVAAFLTLAIFSFLYADNPAYRFTEAVVVGVSAAYWMVVGFWDVVVPKLLATLMPETVQAMVQPTLKIPQFSPWWPETWDTASDAFDPWLQQWGAMALALLLGLMLMWRLLPRGGWIAGWPLAFIVGVTAGRRMVTQVESDLMEQAASTMQSVVPTAQGLSAWDWAWAALPGVLVLVGVVCCLCYFLFSVQHRGVVGGAARVGVWYLMITFGAAFGFTVMGRIALLADRVEFLFDDWLWIIDPNHLRG
ncbi:MAG: hypothetical protein EBQ99_00580 [Planctomycetes bacterium]|nr:hypothetical protein [Planctomycetota bacterium]